ncbi:MAG: hypothetical protein QOE82_157, partial [Thermoanaerobaculia bacterium]|nr:hypothetical protein [Thermoanaerobaculia bacterium]
MAAKTDGGKRLDNAQTQIVNAVDRTIAPIIGKAVESTLKQEVTAKDIEAAVNPLVDMSIQSHLGDFRADFRPPKVFVNATMEKLTLQPFPAFTQAIAPLGSLGSLINNPPTLSHFATEHTD